MTMLEVVSEHKENMYVGLNIVEEAPALVKRALVAAGIEGRLNGQLDMFSRCTVSSIKYGTREATRTDCNIFFDESGGRLVPGVIEYIFAIRSVNGKPKHFIATRRNLPVPDLMTDPFKAYKDFGAGLWKDEHATELNIISLTEGTFCHTISMPWLDGILVMKPLNRWRNEGWRNLLPGNQWLEGGNGYRSHDLCFDAGTIVLIVCNVDNIDGWGCMAGVAVSDKDNKSDEMTHWCRSIAMDGRSIVIIIS
ncbi:hypothetical protein BDN67DRAFT_985763 [Paxillus ammoniavirescens]|nr:hypothetical protein BDN67DRAFT_985763 [Paxillus ammoniavirescens]